MADWMPARTSNVGGYHRILATRAGHTPVDITFLRDAPVQLGSYSDADPFGDAVAQISFPMLGPLDDLSSPELNWLHEDTLIDIWWVPAEPIVHDWDPTQSGDTALWINPLSGQPDIIAPAYAYSFSSGTWHRSGNHRGTKVWEGFIASIEVTQDGSSASMSAQCQGALFQTDLSLAKPFYPSRPQTLESLIIGCFSHTRDPGLATAKARIEWPTGWTLVAPAFTGTSNTFDPNVRPGAKWTGYTTRQTGSWDHQLTGFIQNLLATMLVKPGSGVSAGNQWTLRNIHEGDSTYPNGRTPVLKVRDRFATPDFSMWVGLQGVTLSLTRDATQKADIIYGSGTDLAGTNWRNAVIASNGSRTDYRPLSANKLNYPFAGNPALDHHRFKRESYIQYGTGFNQVDATASADLTRQRDSDPGWSGTITLKVDPSDTFSRWQIRAGMTMLLLGFGGTSANGMRFHIASVEASPMEGSVALTVDTRYRDLPTLNEALARNRDALTPARLLALNRNTVTIEDIQAPWDYSLGSGYIPKPSRLLYQHKPTTSLFPYTNWVKAHPPTKHPHSSWFVPCQAHSGDSKKRWAGPIQILMSEKGTIRRSEFFMVDRNGNLVPQRFHVSLYYNNGINATSMPNNGKTWSPWLTGAFEAIDPSTGEVWTKPGTYAPDNSLVMGWGNYAQPAGYSPGLKVVRLDRSGARNDVVGSTPHPTGMLVDETSWSYDCSANNPNYDHLAKAGGENPQVISLYAMFYAEWTETVYFGGRLFREEPGSSG